MESTTLPQIFYDPEPANTPVPQYIYDTVIQIPRTPPPKPMFLLRPANQLSMKNMKELLEFTMHLHKTPLSIRMFIEERMSTAGNTYHSLNLKAEEWSDNIWTFVNVKTVPLVSKAKLIEMLDKAAARIPEAEDFITKMIALLTIKT